MEQELINAFMKLTAKAGAGELVKQIVWHVEQNGNPRVWSPQEVRSAVVFIHHIVKNFSKDDALVIIHKLMHQYEIKPADLEGGLMDQESARGLQ